MKYKWHVERQNEIKYIIFRIFQSIHIVVIYEYLRSNAMWNFFSEQNADKKMMVHKAATQQSRLSEMISVQE